MVKYIVKIFTKIWEVTGESLASVVDGSLQILALRSAKESAAATR